MKDFLKLIFSIYAGVFQGLERRIQRVVDEVAPQTFSFEQSSFYKWAGLRIAHSDPSPPFLFLVLLFQTNNRRILGVACSR